MWLGALRGKHRTQKLLAVATEFSLQLCLPGTDLKQAHSVLSSVCCRLCMTEWKEGMREESDFRNLL